MAQTYEMQLAIGEEGEIYQRMRSDKTCVQKVACTGNGPSNRAMCNNIALALIFHRHSFDSVPQAPRHFNLNRNEAFAALLSPT